MLEGVCKVGLGLEGPSNTAGLGAGLKSYALRTNLLNWCNLVSISKNVVFYAFLAVRIY